MYAMGCQSIETATNLTCKTHNVPVYFGGENGPDLAYVADFHHTSENEIIRLFTERAYRVYMLGFLPGFVLPGGA